ncbi:hypothetical protein ACFFTM_23515 [Pseudoduganella plicata]|uniref:HEAT repeat domain-containing protein n=1 Tax=Pseudoduganella plicata TaxID=321984 RepID=A0A4P7BGB2_9BURK|nr:hypothetical protein [Pseudoduganella plicata]QBQ37310.1 hypothetical protein E1742_14855 [Pseudoduganella plicata]GGZ11201.1 hypothetical protein GCM10007388_50750 [Pseudoduganella plicata]
MKLIRKTGLLRRQKDGAVHCEIELCESTPGRYLVNVRQGRIAADWRESALTAQPVDLDAATRLFERAVAERIAQGFADPAAAPPAAPAAPVAPVGALTEADRAVLRRLERGSWQLLDQAQRNRTIWRIGERRLRAAVPTLVEQIERGDAMQDYCIAWAIGRCGDAGAAIAMRELHMRSATDAVRRVALLAWLLLASRDERMRHAQALTDAWPDALRSAFTRRDMAALPALFDTDSVLLEQLDQVALCDPFARELLLALLRQVPLEAGPFRAVRHLYKAAELRADGEVFALLQRRFETTPHQPDRYLWSQGRYVGHAQSAALPETTAAYSVRTRHYLLRRGWRTLRRLGEQDDPTFIPMALAQLEQLDDRAASQPSRRGGRTYDRYAHWPMFNHLLRNHAGLRSSRSGLAWYGSDEPRQEELRTEAFREIWDRHPEALLTLMRRSRCAGVHDFAARALADNHAFCASLAIGVLRDLLRSPYEATARFAFTVARARFEPTGPDADWLMLLVLAALPQAREYAMEWIGRDPARYAADAALVTTILCAPDGAVRRHGWILCQAAQRLPGMPEAIVLRLFDWLEHCGDVDAAETTVPAIAADLVQAIDLPLRSAAARAPYEPLLRLAGHPLAAVRLLAGRWLLLHKMPVSGLPGMTLTVLLRDPDVDVRAVAVRLFAALPDHVLTQQLDLVASFATSPDTLVRGAIDAVVARLAGDSDCRDALLPALMDSLFRSETAEGVHDDVLRWLTGPLGAAAQFSDPDLLRRLLAARGNGAQRLGALLIGRFDARQFDVADWAAFGRNQNAIVRRWAYDAFTAHPDMARGAMEAALRLFDSKFDDTREFATGYFGTVCTRDDWTPLLLVNLCDHADPAAQRFGRAMITTYFDVADVTEFMLKLSQHPSANMQLFVSGWLESACGGDADKLRRLEPYFLAVLSQVNRGRVVKSRVQHFLREQAMLSQEIAAVVSHLFARQVVTVAITDKAQYIEGLRAIHQRYPALPPVMTIRPPALRAGSMEEAR